MCQMSSGYKYNAGREKPSIRGKLSTIEFLESFYGFGILVHYYFNGNLDFKTPTYLTILPGLRSKFFLTISVSSVDVFDDVPKLKTVIERGSATPMAYDTWTRQRRQRPALTKDLATHLWKKGETIRNWQNYFCFNCYQLKKISALIIIAHRANLPCDPGIKVSSQP